MKLMKTLVIFVTIFTISSAVGISACFGQGMSNYELEQEVTTLKEKIQSADLLGGLSFSGAVEVEAGFENGYGDEKTSDITLATVELGLEAKLSEWARATVVLLWEEDDTPPGRG
jgi:hypothetical protein